MCKTDENNGSNYAASHFYRIMRSPRTSRYVHGKDFDLGPKARARPEASVRELLTPSQAETHKVSNLMAINNGGIYEPSYQFTTLWQANRCGTGHIVVRLYRSKRCSHHKPVMCNFYLPIHYFTAFTIFNELLRLY